MTSTPDESSTCATCGRPLSEHNRDVRFRLPDPVLDLPDQERTDGVWMSHDDAIKSVMMQVPGVGPFCRSLLPIHLDGGYTLHFGVWIAIHPNELQRAFSLWWTPEYETLELDGYLANSLPGWGGLASPVHAVVRDSEHTPYLVSSTNAELEHVLVHEWPHEEVLARLPA